jgi:hypothetical protein
MDQYIETVTELRKALTECKEVRVNPPVGGYAFNVKVSKASIWANLAGMDGSIEFTTSQPYYDGETLYIG